MSIHPVILCGGSGTRLWPLSRSMYPKQFLSIGSEKSLLQETVERVSGDAFADPIFICNGDHRFLVAEQMRAEGVKTAAILLEPQPRNTAPAAAVAALKALELDPKATIFLMPSDHAINHPEALRTAISLAQTAAFSGHLVTFGIKPTGPETGYGYIRRGRELDGAEGCYTVEKFIEKPDHTTAVELLQAGGHDWNSGMFLFGAKEFLSELEELEPDMVAACREALAKGSSDLDFFRLDEESFSKAPSRSIDVAVMEKTAKAVVVPAEMGWSDVGAWSAMWLVDDHDENGNVVIGDVISEDVSDSYLRSEGPLLAAIGLEDTIVIVTGDAVLVAPKNRAADVKRIVERLQKDERVEHIMHPRVHRPWGWYQGVDSGSSFQVKRLCVMPGARLSLQMHHRRAEHWVVVSGTARVTRDDDVFELHVNESTYIPVGAKHRLENPGVVTLHMIEVQSGEYLGEDDIVRFDDDYARDSSD